MQYIDKWCHQKCYVMIMKSMKDNEIVTLWPKTHKNDQIQPVLAHIGNKRYRNYAARCDSSRLIMSSKLLRYNKSMIKFWLGHSIKDIPVIHALSDGLSLWGKSAKRLGIFKWFFVCVISRKKNHTAGFSEIVLPSGTFWYILKSYWRFEGNRRP